MATTQTTYTGNGSTTNYSFTFEYINQTDVKASLDGTVTTDFSLDNATTVAFDTAPASGVNIIIFRDTKNDDTVATFFAGSAIKAEDLNSNFDQTLYVSQETQNNALNTLGGTMSGELNMGSQKIVSLGTPTADADASTKAYVDGLITTHQAQVDAAAASETAAAASETAAATSETNAATSATGAANSATTATTQATNSGTSATAAAASETAAAASETAAAASETAAATSATTAANEATTATTQATAAATSATNAANSATASANSAVASNNSAVASNNSAVAAATSAAAALAAFDNFDDTYLGAFAVDPTTDNDGDALTAGDLYFNTTNDVMRVFIGTVWVTAFVPGDAANITNAANGNLASTNVQASLQELQTDIDTLNTNLTANDTDIATQGNLITGNATQIGANLAAINTIGPLVTTNTTDIATNTAAIANRVVQTGATGSAQLPVGTQAQRDATPVAGMIRFNDDIDQFEGFNGTAWSSVGGGATGGGGDRWAIEMDNTITQDFTVTTGRNVMSAGPLTINAGATVTVPAGSTWVIV
jgi:chemotaxis protein histidine kinase CheA